MSNSAKELFERRKRRVRWQIRMKGRGRPRLSVFRSNQHIYAQVIDDTRGHTMAAASTLDRALRAEGPARNTVDGAAAVGRLVAERAREAGVEQVVLDRGGYAYHGRVKALADAAREEGLKF